MVVKVIIRWGNFRQGQVSIVGGVQGWQTEDTTAVLGEGRSRVWEGRRQPRRSGGAAADAGSRELPQDSIPCFQPAGNHCRVER